MVVEVSGDEPVEQSCLGRSVERHVVADARQAPVVLPFEVVAVAVFHHAYGQHVLARSQEARHVVLRRLLSTLVVAHLLTVEPHERAALHLFQTQEHLSALPLCGQTEGLAIGTRGVVLAWHVGRVGLEWRRYVAELRVAVASHLPVERHGYSGPLAVLEVRREELRRHLLGRVGKEESPRPVQRQVVGRQVVGMALLLAFLEDRGIFDVVIQVFQVLGVRLQRAGSR